MPVYKRKGNYHTLRKNLGMKLPQRAIFLDTETKHVTINGVEHHTLKLGWTFYYRRDRYDIHNGNNWKYHTDPTELWSYIVSYSNKEHPLYIFGHNIYFDLQATEFFALLTKWGWNLDFVYDKGLSYILVITKDGSTIRCISTTNFFDFSLEKLGKIVGVDKISIEFDNSSIDELSLYCKQDVRILVLAMEQYWDFIREHKLGNFAMTRASQAMHAYRHRFMHHDIIIHDDKNIISLERAAYYGGRVEAFYIGKLPDDEYVSLDINSMYPYVMQKYKYPTKFLDYKENIPVEQLKWVLNRYMVIAEVEIKTDDAAYAIRRDGKLIFPIGHFVTYLCSEGLKYAIEHNHIVKVNKAAAYKGEYLFNEWVSYMYPLKDAYRSQGNTIYAQIVKILLNSLYGKFGQTEPIEEKIESIDYTGYYREESFSIVTGEHWTTTQLLNKKISHYGEQSSVKAFVAIPAHVTENARLLLWSIVQQVGRDRVLYVDTDSIKIRKSDIALVKYPINSSNIGALDIEDEFSSGFIYGAKDYRIGDKVVLKGVPRKAIQVKNGVYHYSLFPGQSTHLRLRIADHYIVEHTEKVLSREYSKGMVTSSGVVLPFHLSM